jgi:RNA polymerase primary sigma factor
MAPIITTDEITFWMNAAGSKPILSKDEVCLIARKIRSSEPGSLAYKRCVNKLVAHNLRLVIRSVHLHMGSKTRKNWGGVETLDFLQAGALGLIRAAEKYDPEMGYTFATYATFWIRSAIGRYGIKASSIFHIPENACRDAYAFEKHGFIRKKSKEESMHLTQMVRSAQSAISIDAPIRENADISIVDAIESTYAPPHSGQGRFSPEMEEAMKIANLTADQVLILEWTFIDEMKVKDIIKMTDMTKNQVCHLRKTALHKLKLAMVAV